MMMGMMVGLQIRSAGTPVDNDNDDDEEEDDDDDEEEQD